MGIARGTIVLLGTWLAVAVVSGQEEGAGHRHGNYAPQEAGPARLARVAAFLRRLDTNGNGMIEEEEATGFQRQVLERVLSRNGIKVKFPISIEQVMQATTSAARSEGSDATGGGLTPAVVGVGPAPDRRRPARGRSPGLAAPSCSRPSPAPAPPGNVAEPPVGADSTTAPVDPPGISPSSNSGESAPGKARAAQVGAISHCQGASAQGLPDWFIQKDTDGDGQISMAEFASQWTPEKVREFESYDRNHDGFITAAECLQTEKEKQAASRRLKP